ncbi:cytochrome d ubiquinol oxidase subunit II [Solirubrobacter phytolaccae]|uniref:Cytochrome d ubiquinol oxidase subunit II n=1 Tax=Solirubrobacter phytolaccae TaxID=1404360 RepID=A0A9X3NDW8_9ACTN|nr:cytochrome d ubiquinol oxidase subunit II [Solirubrobacter phytolaccae]MDA0183112.1 cytochrome d ubiquinol oxidase subunit II [Solirubrobacter phytolaccae]
MTTLEIVWFLLICVLWIGYLVLEGFDFGAGALVRVLGKTTEERGALLRTFGPVWDGNEVWLIVAGGATFAAFPHWYATLFSGFYLALFLLLVALIIRNVGVEFWGKDTGARWKSRWEWAIVVGSALPAVLLGVAWANIAGGVPLTDDGEFAGTFWTLLNPYALAGGVTSLVLFLAHGSHFLALRTEGELHARAVTLARRLAPVAFAVVLAFSVWTLARMDGIEPLSAVLAGVAVLAAGAAWWRALLGSEGWAFAGSALSVAALFASLFAWLYPNAMAASEGPALSLHMAASTPYTLQVMTVVAAIFTPLVLLYQGWTYWVFRRRVAVDPA